MGRGLLVWRQLGEDPTGRIPRRVFEEINQYGFFEWRTSLCFSGLLSMEVLV